MRSGTLDTRLALRGIAIGLPGCIHRHRVALHVAMSSLGGLEGHGTGAMFADDPRAPAKFKDQPVRRQLSGLVRGAEASYKNLLAKIQVGSHAPSPANCLQLTSLLERAGAEGRSRTFGGAGGPGAGTGGSSGRRASARGSRQQYVVLLLLLRSTSITAHVHTSYTHIPLRTRVRPRQGTDPDHQDHAYSEDTRAPHSASSADEATAPHAAIRSAGITVR